MAFGGLPDGGEGSGLSRSCDTFQPYHLIPAAEDFLHRPALAVEKVIELASQFLRVLI